MSSKPIFVATHPRACSTAFERVRPKSRCHGSQNANQISIGFYDPWWYSQLRSWTVRWRLLLRPGKAEYQVWERWGSAGNLWVLWKHFQEYLWKDRERRKRGSHLLSFIVWSFPDIRCPPFPNSARWLSCHAHVCVLQYLGRYDTGNYKRGSLRWPVAVVLIALFVFNIYRVPRRKFRVCRFLPNHLLTYLLGETIIHQRYHPLSSSSEWKAGNHCSIIRRQNNQEGRRYGCPSQWPYQWCRRARDFN